MAWLHNRIIESEGFHQMKHRDTKIGPRRTRTVEQLNSYMRQEWDSVPLPKVQELSSQFLNF